eukprot:scaffold71702_cov25-Cyclotella_meneghiniana.AAC.2
MTFRKGNKPIVSMFTALSVISNLTLSLHHQASTDVEQGKLARTLAVQAKNNKYEEDKFMN